MARTDLSMISSEDVHGTDVYGPRRIAANEDYAGEEAIGEIDHLMIDKATGRVTYAVMSFGGFLGLGHSQYPLPWAALTYDTSIGGYRTNVTERQLNDAPGFDDDSWSDRAWEARTHEHYRVPAYWDRA